MTDKSMRCPHCSARHALRPARMHLPWFGFPLRWLVAGVKCRDCLTKYYRVRLLGVLIRRDRATRIPPVLPFP